MKKSHTPSHTLSIFRSRKGNIGISLFLGVILFNILMYFVIYAANADPAVGSIGSGGISLQNSVNGTTAEDISSVSAAHWYDGFNVSVFDLPWWVNIFYITFQAILISLSIYALIRGLQ